MERKSDAVEAGENGMERKKKWKEGASEVWKNMDGRKGSGALGHGTIGHGANGHVANGHAKMHTVQLDTVQLDTIQLDTEMFVENKF